jgi:hypothetical protein
MFERGACGNAVRHPATRRSAQRGAPGSSTPPLEAALASATWMSTRSKSGLRLATSAAEAPAARAHSLLRQRGCRAACAALAMTHPTWGRCR